MKRIYFSKFFNKMRFPLFCTFRLNYEHWKKSERDPLNIRIGNWHKPEESTALGIAYVISVTQYKYGLIPKQLINFDTDLKLLDAQELFMQMHREQWEGDSTNVGILMLFWTDRYKPFFKLAERYKEIIALNKADRRQGKRQRKY